MFYLIHVGIVSESCQICDADLKLQAVEQQRWKPRKVSLQPWRPHRRSQQQKQCWYLKYLKVLHGNRWLITWGTSEGTHKKKGIKQTEPFGEKKHFAAK